MFFSESDCNNRAITYIASLLPAGTCDDLSLCYELGYNESDAFRTFCGFPDYESPIPSEPTPSPEPTREEWLVHTIHTGDCYGSSILGHISFRYEVCYF